MSPKRRRSSSKKGKTRCSPVNKKQRESGRLDARFALRQDSQGMYYKPCKTKIYVGLNNDDAISRGCPEFVLNQSEALYYRKIFNDQYRGTYDQPMSAVMMKGELPVAPDAPRRPRIAGGIPNGYDLWAHAPDDSAFYTPANTVFEQENSNIKPLNLYTLPTVTPAAGNMIKAKSPRGANEIMGGGRFW